MSELGLHIAQKDNIEHFGSGIEFFTTVSHKMSSEAPSLFQNRELQSIEWAEVNFSVGRKVILKNCWGNVAAGSLCAILGPSGCGKTSLLNILAGRMRSKLNVEVTQQVVVAGRTIDPITFGQNVAYVMSNDALHATSTPREALLFSAAMRMPHVVNTTVLTDQTLDALGLNDCADVPIGNDLVKGISGGQRKRTSVGIEIITSPSLLFLDEPTSGLDAFSAYNLVTLLKRIAASNCTILCSIHQPSSEIFSLFDIVQFMCGGKVLYHGNTSDAIPYFSALGYHCPSNHNPADYIIFISITEEAIPYHAVSRSCNMPPLHLNRTNNVATMFGHRAPWYKQLCLLLARDFKDSIRNRPALFARFGVTIFLNLLFGVIFLNAGSKNDANSVNFNTQFGAIAIITISTMFGSAQPTILQFPSDRPLFLREYATGTYAAATYFISKGCTEFPLVFLQVLIQFLLVKYLVRLQGEYIFLVLAAWGTAVASSSLGVVLGCLLTDIKHATELAPLLFVPQFLFAGFFIRLEQIPMWLRWAQYICALKYGFNLIMLIEFSGAACNRGAERQCSRLLDSNDVSSNDWWIYVVILACITIGLRTIGCCILAHKAKQYY